MPRPWRRSTGAAPRREPLVRDLGPKTAPPAHARLLILSFRAPSKVMPSSVMDDLAMESAVSPLLIEFLVWRVL